MGFWEKAVEPGDSHLNGSGNTDGKRSEGDTKTGDNNTLMYNNIDIMGITNKYTDISPKK